MDVIEASRAQTSAESIILNELESTGLLTAADLQKRVKAKIRGLKPAQFKALLGGLLADERIHGRPKLGKNQKPTKTIDYALGAPPPLPPPPPPFHERAPHAIRDALRNGARSTKDLEGVVKASEVGFAAAVYKSVLSELVRTREVYPRFKRGAGNKPTKTIEAYSLGGPPAEELIAALVAQWQASRTEAEAVGVGSQALLAAFLAALTAEGLKVDAAAAPPDADRARLLERLRALVAREGEGALISMRELRSRSELPKPRFDRAVLSLFADDVVILHHHDYVGNLSDDERAVLVPDQNGNYYVGVALRGGH